MILKVSNSIRDSNIIVIVIIIIILITIIMNQSKIVTGITWIRHIYR